MTIDERLDKLAERHEALTQTVEIIAGMQAENERRMGKLEEQMTKLSVTTGRLEEHMTNLTVTMDRLGHHCDST